MEYEKYLEKVKIYIKESTKKQRMGLVFVLLLVFGIIVVASDPAKKMLEMRNSERRSDVVNILNAVYQYKIDKGVLPYGITKTPSMICSGKASSCEGLVDLSSVIENEKKILSKIPVDPSEKNPNASGYQIFLSSNGRINVAAPLAENNAVISLSK